MEKSLVQTLESHARDATEFPELRARIEQHRTETIAHAAKVEQCLRLLGEEPKTVKTSLASGLGKVAGAASGMFRDEILKNFLYDYSEENREIASYTALIAAAEELGHTEIARLCEEILDEEVEMAAWLEEKIPEITKHTLQATAVR